MVDDEFPLPRKGDQLFRDDEGDWWHDARLNLFYDNWDMYAEGYKVAGDVLVEYIKEKQFDQDYLVYPIVFLYRQYIELRMKEIIRDGNQLLDDDPEKFPQTHKFGKLWRDCREIIEKVWPEDPAENLDAVGECILQFSEKDPMSMAFRYPTDTNGKPSLPDLTVINLRNLAEVIARIGSLLDGVSMGISVAIEYKREMEAEYSD
jgi:hypothetical protein